MTLPRPLIVLTFIALGLLAIARDAVTPAVIGFAVGFLATARFDQEVDRGR